MNEKPTKTERVRKQETLLKHSEEQLKFVRKRQAQGVKYKPVSSNHPSNLQKKIRRQRDSLNKLRRTAYSAVNGVSVYEALESAARLGKTVKATSQTGDTVYVTYHMGTAVLDMLSKASPSVRDKVIEFVNTSKTNFMRIVSKALFRDEEVSSHVRGNS